MINEDQLLNKSYVNRRTFSGNNTPFKTIVTVFTMQSSICPCPAVKIDRFDRLCFTLCFAEGCLIVRVLFLSLIKVNGEHFAVKIDKLCFTLRFVEGCLIVRVILLSLIKVNQQTHCYEN